MAIETHGPRVDDSWREPEEGTIAWAASRVTPRPPPTCALRRQAHGLDAP